MMNRISWICAIVLQLHSVLAAQPAPRSIFPPGIVLSEKDRGELEAATAELGKEIDSLRADLAKKSALLDLLPDVEIYHKAVHWALSYNEFLRTNEVAMARTLLKQGLERVHQLKEGKAPWTTATGLVVRGYISKIDGSVQPYGLVVPASYRAVFPHQHRFDIWLHGRDNNLTELKFLNDRQRAGGEFTPADTFVLHPYGRYCNAFKFAGEMDVLEAMDHVRRNYPIDESRVAMRGFSMGGAGCWYLATHYAGMWAAAAPGAGFVETAIYTRSMATEPKPAWFEQQLWHFSNATDYALNLFNCPVVAYSGELDKQKEAADTMARILKVEGIEMTHVIGPKTEHRYHPQAKEEVARRIDALMARGRDSVPRRIRFTTWTLRYNQMKWLTVDALEKHWEEARVEAELIDDHTVSATTKNIAALTFSMAPGACPLDATRRTQLILDGQRLEGAQPFSDRSWVVHLRKSGSRWDAVETANDGGLRKRHGLQGPIDDAFMDSFIVVRPTGKAWSERVDQWTKAEMSQAITEWRTQFRGDARVKNDTDITDADIASSHLILWGDPASNQMLGKVARQLPLRWDSEKIAIANNAYTSAHSLPVLVYPNPLNPKRYVVLNSGFTSAKPKSSSNADQTPKLPDYAIVDIEGPKSIGVAGAILSAGFFNENWELK